MNHTYNTFLDKNLHELIRIYQEHPSTSDKVQVVQIKSDIQVFTKPLADLPAPIINEFRTILRRDSSLLDGKDRHVITCATQKSPYPIKEMLVLIMDEKTQYLLRGYQETLSGGQYAFEFETFLETTNKTTVSCDEVAVNFKGVWMNQKTQTGQKYLDICRRAVAEDAIFENFRGALDYQNIIIGGDHERAEAYYQLLGGPTIPEYVKACDAIGNPPINANVGYSTYTLRCLYTMRDIIKHFGPLDGKNILEIGGGHGGLCHMMTVATAVEYKSYTLVDLPLVNSLARRYLEAAGVSRGVRYMSSEEIMPRKYDIVISEYSFSELDTKGQNYYIDSIMKYCQGAYLAMNIWNTDRKEETKRRLMKVFNQIEEYPEEPTSKYPNYKWICRKK